MRRVVDGVGEGGDSWHVNVVGNMGFKSLQWGEVFCAISSQSYRSSTKDDDSQKKRSSILIVLIERRLYVMI